MTRLLILIGGIISFMIGAIIFLVGTGAILGCAGGLIALFLGTMVSFLGLGAVINFIVSANDNEALSVEEIVQMAERNGKWAAFGG